MWIHKRIKQPHTREYPSLHNYAPYWNMHDFPLPISMYRTSHTSNLIKQHTTVVSLPREWGTNNLKCGWATNLPAGVKPVPRGAYLLLKITASDLLTITVRPISSQNYSRASSIIFQICLWHSKQHQIITSNTWSSQATPDHHTQHQITTSITRSSKATPTTPDHQKQTKSSQVSPDHQKQHLQHQITKSKNISLQATPDHH